MPVAEGKVVDFVEIVVVALVVMQTVVDVAVVVVVASTVRVQAIVGYFEAVAVAAAAAGQQPVNWKPQ